LASRVYRLLLFLLTLLACDEFGLADSWVHLLATAFEFSQLFWHLWGLISLSLLLRDHFLKYLATTGLRFVV